MNAEKPSARGAFLLGGQTLKTTGRYTLVECQGTYAVLGSASEGFPVLLETTDREKAERRYGAYRDRQLLWE